MENIRIGDEDLSLWWSALKLSPSYQLFNGIKYMYIHCEGWVDDNKISPPFVVTGDDDFYHTHYHAQYRRELKKFDELCGKGICSVAFGSNHCLALTQNGEVLSWGQNDKEQLGIGKIDDDQKYCASPCKVDFGESIKIIKIACGRSTSYALDENGVVYEWGKPLIYLAPDKTKDEESSSPMRKINFNQVTPDRIVNIFACGQDQAFALDSSGRLFQWGGKINEAITYDPNIAFDSNILNLVKKIGTLRPKLVKIKSRLPIQEFKPPTSCGGAAALLVDGSLWIWEGTSDDSMYAPREVPIRLEDGFKIISCLKGLALISTRSSEGHNPTSKLLMKPILFCPNGPSMRIEPIDAAALQNPYKWLLDKRPLNLGFEISLTDLREKKSASPRIHISDMNLLQSVGFKFPSYKLNSIKKIFIHSLFNQHYQKYQPPFVLTREDEIFYTSNRHQNATHLTKLRELCKIGINSVVFGLSHGLGLTDAGNVVSWCSDKGSRSGIGHKDERCDLSPHQVEFGEQVKIIGIALGNTTGLALSNTGELYRWEKGEYSSDERGSDERSRSGIGNKDDEECDLSPRQVEQVKIKMIACGSTTCFALTTTGKLYGWQEEGYYSRDERSRIDCSPKLIDLSQFTTHPIEKIFAYGSERALALDASGKLIEVDWHQPENSKDVKFEPSSPVTFFASSEEHNLVILDNDSCWISERSSETGQYESITIPFKDKFKVVPCRQGFAFIKWQHDEAIDSLASSSAYIAELDCSISCIEPISFLHGKDFIEYDSESIQNGFKWLLSKEPIGLTIDFKPSERAVMPHKSEISRPSHSDLSSFCSFYKYDPSFLNQGIKNIFIDAYSSNKSTINSPFISGYQDNVFYSPLKTDNRRELKLFDELCGKEIEYLACGADHILALTKHGDVYSWGRNHKGQLGIGTSDEEYHSSPHKVEFGEQVKIEMIACGFHSSYALSHDGHVFGFGWNRYGQLGDGTTQDRPSPIKIDLSSLTLNAIEEIYASGPGDTAYAIDESRNLFGWGHNDLGQVGCGLSDQVIPKPKNVNLPEKSRVKVFAAGPSIAIAILDDGSCWIWGEFVLHESPFLASPVRVNLSMNGQFFLVPCIKGFAILNRISHTQVSLSEQGPSSNLIRSHANPVIKPAYFVHKGTREKKFGVQFGVDHIDNVANPITWLLEREPCNLTLKWVKADADNEDRLLPIISHNVSSKEYTMNDRRRGKCLVFNHRYYDEFGISDREGTEHDVEAIQNLFNSLNFEVIIHHDLTRNQVRAEVLRVASSIDPQDSCFACFIMTHGRSDDILWARNETYNLNMVLKPFVEENCPAMVGKPKLFFVQACRGEEYDHREALEENFSFGSIIPSHRDFLISWSTVPGFVSFRDPEEGSLFIQALCRNLRSATENYQRERIDLLSILTHVHQSLGNDLILASDHNGARQIANANHTLQKLVYLPPAISS